MAIAIYKYDDIGFDFPQRQGELGIDANQGEDKMADFAETGRLPEGGREEKIMSNIVEFNDLCNTCNYGSECVRRKHHGQPVLYCEEFDDFQETPKKPFMAFGEYDAREKFVISRLTSSRNMGLCPFCDNQGTCANTDREGGVWHCEEYL